MKKKLCNDSFHFEEQSNFLRFFLFPSLLFLISILLVFAISPTFAAAVEKQQQKVTGTIIDANEALIGVNIVVEGTTIGTMTDANGNFTIEVPNSNVILAITYIGYNPDRVELAGEQQLQCNSFQPLQN